MTWRISAVSEVTLALLLCLCAVSAGEAATQFEASMDLDLEDVRPLLEHLNENLKLGLDVDKLVRFTESVDVGDEKRLSLPVRYKGQSFSLTYQVYMDDINAADLYFFTETEELATAIQSEMIAFAESLGG